MFPVQIKCIEFKTSNCHYIDRIGKGPFMIIPNHFVLRDAPSLKKNSLGIYEL